MTGFDRLIFEALRSLASRTSFLDGSIVFFARYLVYALVLLFLIRLLKEKGWKEKLLYFSLAALGVIIARGILTSLIGALFEVPRPFREFGTEPLFAVSDPTSFPSGHMAFLISLAAALWILDKRWGIWFFVGSLLVGVSRVIAGVHWPLDIVGGALVGTVGFGVAYFMLRKALPAKMKGKSQSQVLEVKEGADAGTQGG